METTIHINTDFLGQEVIDGIKSMFPHQKVRIYVEPEAADETEFILSKPAYAEELRRRIDYIETGGKTITVSTDDLA